MRCILYCHCLSKRVASNRKNKLWCRHDDNCIFVFNISAVLTDDYLPTELNVFVDTCGDAHGDNGVIPGTDKHEGQAQTHAQEGQSPAGDGMAHDRWISAPINQ